MLGKLNRYLVKASVFVIMAAFIAGMAGCDGYPPPSQNLEIRTWYDLANIRNNLAGHHTLMNDLDSTTPGYEQLASPTANGGKGWDPINGFASSFDGQGYEIHDLFINRPNAVMVGLFGEVEPEGVIRDLGVVNAIVTGELSVGAMVGTLARYTVPQTKAGSVSNSYSSGNVTGSHCVGGLVGHNDGTVSNSYSTGNVTGLCEVGGLVGNGDGTISNSYSTGSVIAGCDAGGLLGGNMGIVRDSYSSSSVTGGEIVGGLVGRNFVTVSNSSATGSVTGSEYVGGLVGRSSGTVDNSYSTCSVSGNSTVGGLAGHNYGDVRNSYSTGSVSGTTGVGGLVGWSSDTVDNSYSTCGVSGNSTVGGLVGANDGAVSNSYSIGNVTGNTNVGGLVGVNGYGGAVSDSFWDIQTSGQATSDGGTGKNTTEMHDIVTFSGAGWNIIGVALNETDPAYIWNIVNNVTYPFLSWQAI